MVLEYNKQLRQQERHTYSFISYHLDKPIFQIYAQIFIQMNNAC